VQQFGDGERVEFHYCNTRNALIVDDETADCVVLTNRRILDIRHKKIALNLPFSMIAKARHQKAKTIGFDKILCTLMSGDVRDVPILSEAVCGFFTMVMVERIKFRNAMLHDSMRAKPPAGANGANANGAGGPGGPGVAAEMKGDAPSPRDGAGGSSGSGSGAGAMGADKSRDRDFSDDATWFIVWLSAPHLVLDVQLNDDDEPMLLLAERTGAISQKWYKHEAGHLVSCLNSAAYKKRRHKKHVQTKPPEWLFSQKWAHVRTPAGDLIRHDLRLSSNRARPRRWRCVHLLRLIDLCDCLFLYD
jgi:hypothetical protein